MNVFPLSFKKVIRSVSFGHQSCPNNPYFPPSDEVDSAKKGAGETEDVGPLTYPVAKPHLRPTEQTHQKISNFFVKSRP